MAFKKSELDKANLEKLQTVAQGLGIDILGEDETPRVRRELIADILAAPEPQEEEPQEEEEEEVPEQILCCGVVPGGGRIPPHRCNKDLVAVGDWHLAFYDEKAAGEMAAGRYNPPREYIIENSYCSGCAVELRRNQPEVTILDLVPSDDEH